MQKVIKPPLSIKRTDQMDVMLDYLSEKWLLNPTAVMRHALAIAYGLEKKKDKGDMND